METDEHQLLVLVLSALIRGVELSIFRMGTREAGVCFVS